MKDYKIANIKLADWGSKEVKLAESEMPGLMELRRKHGKIKPLKRDIARLLTRLNEMNKK